MSEKTDTQPAPAGQELADVADLFVARLKQEYEWYGSRMDAVDPESLYAARTMGFFSGAESALQFAVGVLGDMLGRNFYDAMPSGEKTDD